jgi:hypothetical protein
MKRRKKLETRLAQKAAAGEAPQKESLTHKVTHKVKELAKGAVEKVEGALHAAVEKVKGAVK